MPADCSLNKQINKNGQIMLTEDDNYISENFLDNEETERVNMLKILSKKCIADREEEISFKSFLQFFGDT